MVSVECWLGGRAVQCIKLFIGLFIYWLSQHSLWGMQDSGHLIKQPPLTSELVDLTQFLINLTWSQWITHSQTLFTALLFILFTESFYLARHLQPMTGLQSICHSIKQMTMTLLLQCEKILVLSLKKCNLTLAMSPTCHSNNTIIVCWHELFWECSQSQFAQCQIYRSSMVLSVSFCKSPRVASVRLTKKSHVDLQIFFRVRLINVLYCGKVSASQL